MVGDREVTEDEFMAIVTALPKLRVSTIVSWLEKHADGAISPLCCANLWSMNVLFVGTLQNAKCIMSRPTCRLSVIMITGLKSKLG